jgi:thiamine kinase-like enzyme
VSTIRVSATRDVLVNAVKDELDWARRIGNVVPAQRPLSEPLVIGDWTVTLWQWLDGEPATTRNAAAHGALLRRLHDHGGQPPSDVEARDQLASARARLLRITNSATQRRLSEMVEHAAEILDQAASGQLVLSHGDAHDRNLLVVGGVLHLLDFDSAGWAERHVDVASGIYAWRYNHHDEAAVAAFRDGYGVHPDVPPALVDGLVWARRVRATCTRAAANQEVSSRLDELGRTRP